VPEAEGRCWSAARRGPGPAGAEGNEVGGGGVVRGRAGMEGRRRRLLLNNSLH
jgi:hypothetical protein